MAISPFKEEDILGDTYLFHLLLNLSLNITIDNVNIGRKTEARFIGVIADETLTWTSR